MLACHLVLLLNNHIKGFAILNHTKISSSSLFDAIRTIGQMLEFFATAIMGRGRDHAKWSPVCGVTFASRKIGVIKNKSKCKILWDLNLEITEKDFKGGKLEDIEKVAILERELNHVGEGTEEMREFKDAIVIEEVPEEFILSFETDGSMTPRVAFERATKELSSRFDIISKDIISALK